MSETDNSYSSLHYDMNVLDEYISLFGDPFTQSYELINNNVVYMNWPREEIESLFEEMHKKWFAGD